MVIRTSENEYPVIGVKENSTQYDTYICRDIGRNELCSIISFKDAALFPALVSFLTDTVNREAFTDFKEYFIFDGKLCMVMKYAQGITLGTKLATESVPFRERLELGRKILEKAVIQDIPDFFLAKCMTPDQIIVASDLTVSFNYPVENIITDMQQNGRGNIEAVFRLLFAPELERKVPELLMDFFGRLPALTEQRLLDIYSEYYELAGQLEEYDANTEQPKTFWFRLWDKIKSTLKVLKKILIILLILASIAFLIYTIIDSVRHKDGEHLKSIGTVQIRELETEGKETTAPSIAASESIVTETVTQQAASAAQRAAAE